MEGTEEAREEAMEETKEKKVKQEGLRTTRRGSTVRIVVCDAASWDSSSSDDENDECSILINMPLKEYRKLLNEVVEEVFSEISRAIWGQVQSTMMSYVVVNKKFIVFKEKNAIYKEVLKQSVQKRNPMLSNRIAATKVGERPSRKRRQNIRLDDL